MKYYAVGKPFRRALAHCWEIALLGLSKLPLEVVVLILKFITF